MENCPHLCRPSPAALEALHDPLRWSCSVCSSTDGVWCCLTCGHVGCGRRAHMPALGGGHSKHHFQVHHSRSEITSLTANKEQEEKEATPSFVVVQHGHDHEVCLDLVSKAVHCYICDDYVLSDAPWLSELRAELETLETAMEEDDEDVEMMDVEGENEEKCEDDSAVEVAPGRTGLHNLGNTCYMNSVLQMLSHCSGFRSFFRDFLRAAAPLRLGDNAMIIRQSTVRLKDALQQSDKGSGSQMESDSDSLALTEATHAILRVLWSGKWKAVAPRTFVHAVWTHGGIFAARRQQDANEFLNFVLGRLDEEINSKSNNNGNGSNPLPQQPLSPILKDLFGFDQNQEVQCDGCNTVTKRTEPLLGLVLSLPDDDEKKESKSENSNAGKSEALTLQSCLETLQSTERLEGDNQFYCDTCQGKRDATKTVVLRHIPQAMLISFRRTRWDAKRGLHKDKRRVEFPLELDATSLLGEETISTEGGKNKMQSISPAAIKVPKRQGAEQNNNNFLYRLSSIVSHSGSSPFLGHYIAWCREDQGTNKEGNNDEKTKKGSSWYLFNDAKVTETTEEKVLAAEAFILLYERQGPAVLRK